MSAACDWLHRRRSDGPRYGEEHRDQGLPAGGIGLPQVEALMLGNDGLQAHLRPGSVIIDCSTSNPVSTLTLAANV